MPLPFMTTKGIEYNLKISPYFIKVCDTTFYFSSSTYLRKFSLCLEDKITEEALKILNKYNLHVGKYPIPILIMLYESIEKRGFYIVHKEVPATCRQNIILNGEVRISIKQED